MVGRSGTVVLSGHPHGARCVMSALIGDVGMVLTDLESVCGKFFGIICKSFNVDSDKHASPDESHDIQF